MCFSHHGHWSTYLRFISVLELSLCFSTLVLFPLHSEDTATLNFHYKFSGTSNQRMDWKSQFCSLIFSAKLLKKRFENATCKVANKLSVKILKVRQTRSAIRRAEYPATDDRKICQTLFALARLISSRTDTAERPADSAKSVEILSLFHESKQRLMREGASAQYQSLFYSVDVRHKVVIK